MKHQDSILVAESVSASSIGGLLEAQAASYGDKGAIVTPGGRSPLTYRGLQQQAAEVVVGLNGLGVGRGDRVAIALANGPEMATAFLGTAAAAVAAPLNPAYTAAEFEFYLADLAARAVIVEAGADSPVRAVAKALGIAVIEMSPRRDAEAGRFDLVGEARSPATKTGLAEGGEVALILHTSGTTSRPKMIPLTQANLCVSAQNVRSTLRLVPDDRCLNVMPLFHIHGLVAGLLSSLSAGASVICTPGFSSIRFFQWMDECQPTWYTAVPAIHQEVLARATENTDTIARCRFRFIRSSSSALAPRVMAEMEEAFDAPVVEAYGMTEASHQIACNPLPPGQRKAGSVGLPAGPDVSILNDAGQPLPPGELGEIAIRGANVTSFRPGGPDGASRDAWFRTGDLGFRDPDGYVFIAGRSKEIINRGGEKISPREIDEVILEHPGVAQAVACAIPDSRLGEDVLAVVVRRPGAAVTERELREFAANRLAHFKIPRRVMFVDQIPKGPTGKIQRIGLAARLGIDSLSFSQPGESRVFVAPLTPNETVMAEIWKDVLKLSEVGATDNFFELGGDSLASVELGSRIEQQLGVTMDVRELVFGTLQQVAATCAQPAPPPNGTEKRKDDIPGNGSGDMSRWRRFRRRTRKLLVAGTAPVAIRVPIDKYPGWFGTLHNFHVPNNAPPRVWQGPGGGTNVKILLRLLESVRTLDGDVAECGVWKADTLIPVGLFLKQRGIHKTAFGFDSFEGLDETVQVDVGLRGDHDERKIVGGFSDTSYEELVDRTRQYNLENTVRLVKGYFQNTLEGYADRRFCFVHLDCVIYESYRQCLEFFYPRLVRGGVILLDEYRDPPWPGCTQAVDEFLAHNPEKLDELTSDNQIKYYLRKA